MEGGARAGQGIFALPTQKKPGSHATHSSLLSLNWPGEQTSTHAGGIGGGGEGMGGGGDGTGDAGGDGSCGAVGMALPPPQAQQLCAAMKSSSS